MEFTGAIDLYCALERKTLSTLKRSFYDEMAACFGVLIPLFGAQATQDPEVCTTVFACLSCRPTAQRPNGVTRQLGAKAGARHGDAGATRDPGFQAMPPRGLCMDCSAEDYQAIIG
jgi:hypothetical protein